MSFRALIRRGTIFAALVVVVTTGMPTAAGTTSYITPISGRWVTDTCLPTSVNVLAFFPMPYTGVCTGTVTGSWVGKFVDYNKGYIVDSNLGLTAVHEIYLYGRAPDASCGRLRIRVRSTVSGETLVGVVAGIAKIYGAEGHWKGSTGIYRVNGSYLGGAGNGTYAGWWRRVGTKRSYSAASCRPGSPPPPPPVGRFP